MSTISMHHHWKSKVSTKMNSCITVQCESYEHLLFLFSKFSGEGRGACPQTPLKQRVCFADARSWLRHFVIRIWFFVCLLSCLTPLSSRLYVACSLCWKWNPLCPNHVLPYWLSFSLLCQSVKTFISYKRRLLWLCFEPWIYPPECTDFVHFFSKFSGGACPRTPLEGRVCFADAHSWLRHFNGPNTRISSFLILDCFKPWLFHNIQSTYNILLPPRQQIYGH